ncbi:MAG: hypothetical protein GXX86_11410 [Propionibacterium sp.]|nr:hypothetical protein [Propionibacterium sp.]
MAVALVATGCAQAPDNYAVVNGDEISARELRAEHEAFNEEIAGLMQQESPEAYGTFRILHLIVEDLAEEKGIDVSGTEVNTLIRELGADQIAATGPTARQYVDDVAYIQLVMGEVGQEEFNRAVDEADVVLNPRYGTWGPGVQPGGSLAQPAPVAPPAAP